jgi:hypothetical protein
MSKIAEHHADGTRAVAPLQNWHDRAGAAAAGGRPITPLPRNSFLQRTRTSGDGSGSAPKQHNNGNRRRIRSCNQPNTHTRTHVRKHVLHTRSRIARLCSGKPAKRGQKARHRKTAKPSSSNQDTSPLRVLRVQMQKPRQQKTGAHGARSCALLAAACEQRERQRSACVPHHSVVVLSS